MPISEQALYAVGDRASLFAFLHDQLGWPVDPDDTFTYTDPLLHGDVATRAEVSQIVPFTTGDPYTIMLVEFETQFRRTDLREILRRMREEIRKRAKYGGRKLDEIVFVCATESYGGIRFARFEEQAGSQPRMSVFGWDRSQPGSMRTLQEFNLPALKMPARNVLGEHDWSQARWDEAWDVEKVTREFFREYRQAFEAVEQMIAAHNPEQKRDWRLSTQRLFNRLMFIQFLSKRGWLRFAGSTDYLATLFQKSSESGENFYHDRLYWAFFYGLGSGEVGQKTHELAELQERRGDVPYLNGGLFEMVDDGPTPEESSDRRGALLIPNAAFERIIDGLFARWNFTISESTPLDVEVAVDPEMLGKVFEELVTGRHESGSYYTPRGIVAFMCREALKHYLEAEGIPADAAATFVDVRSTAGFREKDFETTLAALKRVRVVDPACGSGAYLLGMLHELVELRKLLFNPNRKDDPRDDYGRKLDIIRRNLYGVDLDEFAVNIARLRLWLSLAVEYEGTTPEPLPNLDFKIEQGDSLSAPDPGNMGDIDIFRYTDIAECEQKKAQYADPYYKGDKRALRREIETMCDSISAWTHKGKKVDGFDWRVQFGEVFAPQASVTDLGGGLNLGGTLAEPVYPGGFDIVVANPPYVRQELIKDIKPILQQTYPGVYNGTADLYTYFYARAVQLLREGGVLSFISPNKWFRAGYGANLRKYFAEQCRVHSIIDFGDLPVFESATTYPMVFVAQKGKSNGACVFTKVKSLQPPYPDVLALIQQSGQVLPPDAIKGKDWTLTDNLSADRLRKMDTVGMPLGQYIKGQIYYGIKTGFNTAFVINSMKRAELIAQDARSAEIIKPLALGRDIRKWAIDYEDRWLIVTKIGVDMAHYPAIKQHLCQWQAELEKRWDKGEHWWELRACAYYSEFDRPKILYQEIATYQAFALDRTGAFVNNKVFLIPVDDLYLLGILNSESAWQYLSDTCSKLSGGAFAMQTPYLNKLPIPDASNTERQAIAALVQKCLDAKGVGCEVWEQEINGRVAALYGL
jgi:hypothetical protein